MKVKLDGDRLVVVPETVEERERLMDWVSRVPMFQVLSFSLVEQFFRIDVATLTGYRPPTITLEDSIERRLDQGSGKAEAIHEIERLRWGSKRK
jgi:hypothetical protein